MGDGREWLVASSRPHTLTDAEILRIGFGLPGENAHAPNEWLGNLGGRGAPGPPPPPAPSFFHSPIATLGAALRHAPLDR